MKKSKDGEVTTTNTELADALVAAIQATKPVEKKTVFTRVKNTPWTPKDGSPRAKLKRKMYQHGLPITTRVTNEEIELLNKLKPGRYCDGNVTVTKRKDKGLDIDYKIRTAAQRLKLVNLVGHRNFKELLERIVLEQANPKKYDTDEDDD